MFKAVEYKNSGYVLALLIMISGCASTPYCTNGSCQTEACQTQSCDIDQTNCSVDENTGRCKESKTCCDQSCKPKKRFTGIQYIQCFDNFGQSKNARCCANKALKCIKENTETDISSDFKSGFRKAYQDISMGRKGTTPAIPPEKYWYAYYRGSTGKVRAQEWFSGYEKGVEMAKASGLYDSRAILSSYMRTTEY